MDKEKCIASIENRTQLALVMAIFFPSLLGSFLENSGADSKATIAWSVSVGVYILIYVIFQGLKRFQTSEKFLKFLNGFILFNITLFIFPTVFLATADGSKVIETFTEKINAYTFFVSLWGLPISAIILLLLVSGTLILKLFFKK